MCDVSLPVSSLTAHTYTHTNKNRDPDYNILVEQISPFSLLTTVLWYESDVNMRVEDYRFFLCLFLCARRKDGTPIHYSTPRQEISNKQSQLSGSNWKN